MKTIHRYQIPTHGKHPLQIPKGSTLLAASAVIDDIMLWVLGDQSEKDKEEIDIQVFSTGEPIENVEGLQFLGIAVPANSRQSFYIFKHPGSRTIKYVEPETNAGGDVPRSKKGFAHKPDPKG